MKTLFAALLVAALSISTATAGNVNGKTLAQNNRVNANSTVQFTATFDDSEMAIVMIVGDGDTDLDLFVYDERGREVCRDNDYTDLAACAWEVRRTHTYTIEIRNLGDVYNIFSVFTN